MFFISLMNCSGACGRIALYNVFPRFGGAGGLHGGRAVVPVKQWNMTVLGGGAGSGAEWARVAGAGGRGMRGVAGSGLYVGTGTGWLIHLGRRFLI